MACPQGCNNYARLLNTVDNVGILSFLPCERCVFLFVPFVSRILSKVRLCPSLTQEACLCLHMIMKLVSVCTLDVLSMLTCFVDVWSRMSTWRCVDVFQQRFLQVCRVLEVAFSGLPSKHAKPSCSATDPILRVGEHLVLSLSEPSIAQDKHGKVWVGA